MRCGIITSAEPDSLYPAMFDDETTTTTAPCRYFFSPLSVPTISSISLWLSLLLLFFTTTTTTRPPSRLAARAVRFFTLSLSC